MSGVCFLRNSISQVVNGPATLHQLIVISCPCSIRKLCLKVITDTISQVQIMRRAFALECRISQTTAKGDDNVSRYSNTNSHLLISTFRPIRIVHLCNKTNQFISQTISPPGQKIFCIIVFLYLGSASVMWVSHSQRCLNLELGPHK